MVNCQFYFTSSSIGKPHAFAVPRGSEHTWIFIVAALLKNLGACLRRQGTLDYQVHLYFLRRTTVKKILALRIGFFRGLVLVFFRFDAKFFSQFSDHHFWYSTQRHDCSLKRLLS